MANRGDKAAFVVGELKKLKGRTRFTDSNAYVSCPFHEGDNTPSCNVYLKPSGKVPLGWYYCFGCGAKGPWDNLAKVLGLSPMIDGVGVTHVSKEVTKAARERLLGTKIKLPKGSPWDKSKPWRGISGKTVCQVGGYNAMYKGRHYLILPVVVDGKLVTYIRAFLEKIKGVPSYLNAKQAGLREAGLFPFDSVKKKHLKRSDYVVIVEGPRDQMHLTDEGVPSLAILGSESWSDDKRRLLLRFCRRHSVEPLIMMDGDAPGQKAQDRLLDDLEPHCGVQHIDLLAHFDAADEMDPAKLPDPFMQQVKAVVQGQS